MCPANRPIALSVLASQLTVALALLLPSTSAAAQLTWFVDADATGANTGTSWTDAFVDLRDALAAATSGDQLWVAEGVYRPDGGTKDTDLSFILPSGVALYGGFAGNELVLNERDVLAHPTVLSGDLDGDDTPEAFLHMSNTDDNSHVIVRASGLAEPVTIDGFGIRGGVGGDAAGCVGFEGGGGILAQDSMLLVRQCHASLNYAMDGGAALQLVGGTATLEDCRFDQNKGLFGLFGSTVAAACGSSVRLLSCRFEKNLSTAVHLLSASTGTVEACRFSGNSGENVALDVEHSQVHVRASVFLGNDGGVALGTARGTIEDCLFVGNDTPYSGGAIGGLESELIVDRCTIVANSAHGDGGGLFLYGNLSTVVRDSIVWGNDSDQGCCQDAQIYVTGPPGFVEISHSCIQGWDGSLGGAGNFKANPQFVDFTGADGIEGTGDEDLHLSALSPCIDAGDPATVAGATDVFGAPRTLDGDLDGSMVVDIGGAEFSCVTLEVERNPSSVSVDVESTQPLWGFLLVGLSPGATTIPPFGTLLIQPATLVRIVIGPLPFHGDFAIPTATRLPDSVFLQALGVKPAAGVGNFSNIVSLNLAP